VDVAVTRGGAPAAGVAVAITCDDGAVGAVTEAPGGHYRARIMPAQPSGNVRIHAAALGVTVDRTAIVLPQLDAGWGQAEQVPGLHRQPDGSFAEPFTIGFAVDGATSSPFGYTFVRPPDGAQATLVFAYTDLRNINGDYGPDTGNDLYHDAVTLGHDVNLGTFSLDGKKPVTDRFPALVPVADRAGPQGNPSVSSDGVWCDSEGGAEDLFFAAGDPLCTAPLAAPRKVALSRPDRKETMPYVHGDRLYFSADNAALHSSARAPGGDPAAAATWSAERVELSVE